MLAFGRALGETIAVTMVIGNIDQVPRASSSRGRRSPARSRRTSAMSPIQWSCPRFSASASCCYS